MSSLPPPPPSSSSASTSTAAAAAAAALPNTNTPTAAPRKRRRRAPATGATEDCFTCRKRQAKCDRRRPYCTQCIDLGKECSGYRTTLTWGVGVASRGKLRGMSLPVPKSPSSPPARERAQSMSQAKPVAPTAAQPSVSSPPQGPSYEQARRASNISQVSQISQASQASDVKSPSPIRSPPVHEYPGLDATSPISIPPPAPQHMGWHLPGFGEHLDGYSGPASRKPRPQLPVKPLHKLHTTLAGSYDDTGLSTSTGPLSSYSDSVLGDYPSPSEFPGTPDDFAYADPMIQSYNEHYMHQRTPMSSSTESLVFHDAPRSYPMICEDLSSSISSDQSLQDFSELNSMQPASYSQSGFSDMFFPGAFTAAAGPNNAHIPGYYYSRGSKHPPPDPTPGSHGSSSEHGAVPVLPSPLSRRLSPRMQFLLDYYDRAICPVLVAFDGPSNPYRMHVVPLARESEGLQNAIAALSINNIRMRQSTEARFLALGNGQRASNTAVLPDWVYSRLTADEIREMHGEPSAEEVHYKTTSIQLLNTQLADPIRAKDDSVLATLLILCLFHVCDSGFSKFRTQLAGVQKLLDMRDRSVQSGFIGWVEMFFTWFDVMTSTVNDRETQIKGDRLDMMDLSTNLGALEHLAGCEGRLFKLIARLGRLNLLSQNRPVSSPSDSTPRPSPSHNRRGGDYYSMQCYERLDGNGWGSPASQHHQNPLDIVDADQRHEFWTEWRDIRDRLQQWEFEPTGRGAAMCDAGPYALPSDQRDILHISESFRYSALLYTERLAHPNLPSSALNFQNLVAQALFHISQIGVTSCVNKFLLWPLFITGTECVDETHRALVRQRCIEIQRESGFFNNLSGLEVLERTWREDDAGRNDGDAEVAAEAARLGVTKQAFRWRKAMDRMDGEYILI
ncbi:putative transcriptional regulatory protein C15D4.02 [Diplodia seriata]|uniref:Putative transcriptional regulatory protein C15D4.02 n=1 Tax=Diplodia seriata TaxID=420778 RepID=A0A1S8BD25_9PEZI|nr:putative transcriptional regulatory protein C15D4.02 [Diplodia seriata]